MKSPEFFQTPLVRSQSHLSAWVLKWQWLNKHSVEEAQDHTTIESRHEAPQEVVLQITHLQDSVQMQCNAMSLVTGT
ncbi:hypothetical protein TNCV_4230511 [Trichonephila clavipes]|uniref:Uncharacterized protein n=1 Tax=Trichonephila clavipes TaxID=2585209 RepID=A0A8X6SCV9_TRICX|nr:hypothetical protein TNCV_4230511 [Trichonephila clavipes]